MVDAQDKQFNANVKALSVEERKKWVAKYFAVKGAGREKFCIVETGTFDRGEPILHLWLGYDRT